MPNLDLSTRNPWQVRMTAAQPPLEPGARADAAGKDLLLAEDYAFWTARACAC